MFKQLQFDQNNLTLKELFPIQIYLKAHLPCIAFMSRSWENETSAPISDWSSFLVYIGNWRWFIERKTFNKRTLTFF